jgi:hypothetical protein
VRRALVAGHEQTAVSDYPDGIAESVETVEGNSPVTPGRRESLDTSPAFGQQRERQTTVLRLAPLALDGSH